MKVLVMGGTGVIGEGVIPVLLEQGCAVRLVSRGADEHAKEWPDGVETVSADVTDPGQMARAAEGCDVAIHVTGIVEESPPQVTFQRINVDGVRNSLAAADRAGIRRFVFVSSLGAERGASAYHRSKLEGENLVRSYPREWVIVRPGNVYGPGDEMISTLLRFIRTFPIVPLVGRGRQRFQPVWYRDLGRALAHSVDAPDIVGRVLEVSGDDVTSMADLVDRFGEITGRKPFRVPVPSALLFAGARVAETVGLHLPVNRSKLTMTLEENLIEPPAVNAMRATFGVTPTPLADGLRMLADASPEQLPTDGVGALERKRYWAVIEGSRYSAVELMHVLQERITDLIPIEFGAEPGTPLVIERGVTLTASLPVRGTIQMRVEGVESDAFTFATLAGHPLAGVVRFNAEDADGRLTFRVTIYARAANPFDWLAMKTVGKGAQRSNWEELVEKVIELSGGRAPGGVESDAESLDDARSTRAEAWIVNLVSRRKLEEREAAT